MMKLTMSLVLLINVGSVIAQPSIAELLELNNSIMSVSVELAGGDTGTGSGVVINNNYVATDCHVLINAKGVSIAKFGVAYQPVALKADWKHDLCLLKFDSLPFKSVPMRDSATLKYEEEVFTVSHPYHSQVPQPSYGNIKAIYPLDDSVIVRSSAQFAMGSSGGAMFDQHFNLIGITTFKSPGRQGYFYSLPVEWIKRLFDAPDLIKLNSDEVPFWGLPESQRPFFMQIVGPFQQEQWVELDQIVQAWLVKEPNNADAWYYLGVAAMGLKNSILAKQYLTKAITFNPRHLAAQIELTNIAINEGNKIEAEKLRDTVNNLDTDEAESLSLQIAKMAITPVKPRS
ncbi:MAG: trypsin-like peptidase domain-containing protein [Methylophilaceae bacterium]|nr:trypsin-like peptidase domain-containing protein [Methylophilaceae bacterium]